MVRWGGAGWGELAWGVVVWCGLALNEEDLDEKQFCRVGHVYPSRAS